jgi:PAS domain-containing protein
MSAIAKAAIAGKHTGSTYSLQIPSYGTHWFELSVATKGKPRSKKATMIVLIRDITERKKIEEALRDNEYFLNEAQRITGTGSWQIDIPAGKQKLSTMMREMYGFKTDIVNTEACFERIHPDDREKTKQAYYRALKSKSTPLV